MSAPEDVVAAFLAAVERKDLDAAVDLLADDVSCENVPIDPIVGKMAVRATLEAFLAPAGRVARSRVTHSSRSRARSSLAVPSASMPVEMIQADRAT